MSKPRGTANQVETVAERSKRNQVATRRAGLASAERFRRAHLASTKKALQRISADTVSASEAIHGAKLVRISTIRPLVEQDHEFSAGLMLSAGLCGALYLPPCIDPG